MSAVVSAARFSAVFGMTALLVSLAATIVVTRAFGPVLYADYATLLAIASWVLLLAESGFNPGYQFLMKEAGAIHARATLYYVFLGLRVAICTFVIGWAVLLGSAWIDWAKLDRQVWGPGLLLLAGLMAATNLGGQIAYYGLLGVFRHREVLVSQQGFMMLRAIAIAGIALYWQSLTILATVAAAIWLVESIWYHRLLVSRIGMETMSLSSGMFTRSARHGIVVWADKLITALLNVPFLLIVLTPFHGRTELAALAVAGDFVTRALSLMSLPAGNMILPYLNATRHDGRFHDIAVSRVIKLSALTFLPALGALYVFSPSGIPLLFGEPYLLAVPLVLLMAGPSLFEAWGRFTLTTILTTRAQYRAVIIFNVIQASLVAIVVLGMHEFRLTHIVAALAIVKVTTTVGLIMWTRRLGISVIEMLPSRLLQTVFTCAGAGVVVAFLTREWIGNWSALAGLVVFGAAFVLGLRIVLSRDAELYGMMRQVSAPVLQALRITPIK